MARLTAPLLSLGAAGQLGKALVFASWKGIPYARQYVIPENPKSTAQQEIRGIFYTLSEMWKRLPQLARDPWQAAVRGLALTDRNRHIQANVAILEDEVDMNELVMSVSSGQAIPPDSATFVPTAGTITVTPVAPTPPVGYTLTSMTAAYVPDGDASAKLTPTTVAAEETEAPYEIVFTTVPVDLYQCAIWIKWTRDSDSKIFYSAAVRGTADVVS